MEMGRGMPHKRYSIRWKLASMLVPVLGMLVAASGFEVAKALGHSRDVGEEAALVEASLGPHGLLNRLEDERNVAAINLLGLAEAVELPVENDIEARSGTDAALDRLRVDIDRIGGSAARSYAPVFDELGRLDDLRREVDAFDGPRSLASADGVAPFFDRYSDTMGLVFAANRRIVDAIDDVELRRGAELADLSTRQTDLIARLMSELLRADAGGGDANDGLDEPGEIAAVATLVSPLHENQATIERYGVGDYAQLVASLRQVDQVARFPQLVDHALDTGEVRFEDLLAAGAGGEAGVADYVEFRDAVAERLRARADDERAGAAERARWIVVAVLGVLGAALVVTLSVARSITGPLTIVADEATAMARRRLPDSVRAVLATPAGADVDIPELEPIEANTNDEVRELAAALNAVQDVALRLAIEQAVLRRNMADACLNIGRRFQNLLGRQIQLITELERAERDPDRLGALFHLDHLATRMRRNAESLLVLGGLDTPRPYARAVPIGDVVRAAVGEVEDFRRVDPPHLAPVAIAGRAAADLSHLLAELIDNAIVFSHTGRPVEVRGTEVRDGYRLVIIDQGPGMDADALARANRRLAGAEAFTVAPSQYLGHYVAGRLSERHSVAVTLHRHGGTGLTTVVDLPSGLLVPIPGPGFRASGTLALVRATSPADQAS